MQAIYVTVQSRIDFAVSWCQTYSGYLQTSPAFSLNRAEGGMKNGVLNDWGIHTYSYGMVAVELLKWGVDSNRAVLPMTYVDKGVRG